MELEERLWKYGNMIDKSRKIVAPPDLSVSILQYT
jgi:hypothetical protein